MAVEMPEYVAMLRRMLKAAGRRAGEGDEPELAELMSLEAVLAEVIADAVIAQHEAGRSWAEIALATGTSRQAVAKRWGRAA